MSKKFEENLNTEENCTYVLYLDMNSDDSHVLVSERGLPMQNKLCGLFTVKGKILFPETTRENKTIYLCCDLCSKEESIITGGKRLPILRKLDIDEDGSVNMDLNKVLWLNTSDSLLRSANLFLRNSAGEKPSVSSCHLNCTILLFTK